MSELEPYRHVEVVHVEACKECILRKVRRAHALAVLKAVGAWVPWTAMAWMGCGMTHGGLRVFLGSSAAALTFAALIVLAWRVENP